MDASAFLAVLPPTVGLEFPDGRRFGPSTEASRATIVFRSDAIAASLLQAPSLLAFADAFVAGELDVRGDLLAALEAAYALDTFGGVEAAAEDVRPPAEEAVRFHYDVSNDFFGLFLDRRMVYTCAYYQSPDAELDEAQEAKLDLVCRKLDLAPHDRLLDVGCGWGGLVAWAAENYGASVLGVTLSPAQAGHAVAILDAAGLSARARVEHRDYRTLDGEAAFDKIAAVGILEHLGRASYQEYFARLHRLLRPGGLFLNHGITRPTLGTHSSGMTFLRRHVFPGAEFDRIGRIVSRMEDAGFEILDVESLGGHYARTTRQWLARLERRAHEARGLVGERVYKTWIGYLAAAAVAFSAGWIDLHQVLARRPDGSPRRPETRESLYRARRPVAGR